MVPLTKNTPLIFFLLTFFLGVVTLVISYNVSRNPQLAEIFQAGPYDDQPSPPSGSPPGDVWCPPGDTYNGCCSSWDGCDDEGRWDCIQYSAVTQTSNIAEGASDEDSNVLGTSTYLVDVETSGCNCDDDDDDDTTSSPSPSPSGSPSPSPSPSSTPSPSPQASLVCTDLSGVDTNATYDPGDAVTFTCQGTGTNVTLDNAEFRISRDGGGFDPIPKTGQQEAGGTLTATADYTIPAGGYGTYTAQCRVCAGSVCTAWGQAQVAN